MKAALVIVLSLLALVAWAFKTPVLARTALEHRYLPAPSDLVQVLGTTLHVRESGPRDAPALLGGAAPQWELLGFKEFAALALFSIGGLAISQMLWIMSVGSLGIALSSLHINATPFYVMGTLFALGGAWNWTQAWAAAVVALGVLVAQGIVRLGPAGTGSAQAP